MRVLHVSNGCFVCARQGMRQRTKEGKMRSELQAAGCMCDGCMRKCCVPQCRELFGSLRSSSPLPVSFQNVSRPISFSHSSRSLLTHDTRLGRFIQHLLTPLTWSLSPEHLTSITLLTTSHSLYSPSSPPPQPSSLNKRRVMRWRGDQRWRDQSLRILCRCL